MNYKQHFEKSAALRTQLWSELGKVHDHVISHLINPAFMGAPAWPSSRQAFVVIETSEGAIIASDGLSDPYEDLDTDPDNKFNGVGCEMYLECMESFDDIDAAKNSWQFSILYQASQLAAGNPDICKIIREYKWVSTELYDCRVPEEFLNEEGRAGVLLGLESKLVPSTTKLSLEEILLINVKLLTATELAYISEHGENARNEVAEKILKQEQASKTFLDRTSVV